MAGIMDFFTGSDSKMKSFNPESLQALLGFLQGGGLEGNGLFGAGTDYLQNLLSNGPGAYQAFEQPYLERFNQQIAPGIAERFAGMGTGGGALSSSGLQNSLAQAGRGLQTDLAALRGQLQMQALPQAYQYAQGPLQNVLQAAQQIPNQYYERPGQQGFLQGGLNAFAGGFGNSAGKSIFGGI
jgi:hypothetical protein